MVKAVDNVFLNVNAANFTINSNLSTGETEKENGLKIYPNPSKGIFTIESDSKTNISYSLYAMDGKLVHPKKEVSRNGGKIVENVNVSDLPSGVYIIQVDQEGQNISKKLMINK